MQVIPPKLVITVPKATTVDRVQCIKAIRTLTGLGLKEAKDATDRLGETVYLDAINPGLSDLEYHQCRQILERNGYLVGTPAARILAGLRELASSALMQEEDLLANEILQLVLVERLRRGITD